VTDAVSWVKWHFDRWRADEGLRMCGLAARGLWADLLAIMHGCKPYGHLSVNGRAPSVRQIASMVGMTTEKEVGSLIQELEENGVFSRSPDGLIFCRRMIRDHSAREAGRRYGSLGGNPSLISKQQREDNQCDGEGLTPPDNPDDEYELSGWDYTEKEKKERREEKNNPLPPQSGGSNDSHSEGKRGAGTNPRATGTNPRAVNAKTEHREMLQRWLDRLKTHHGDALNGTSLDDIERVYRTVQPVTRWLDGVHYGEAWVLELLHGNAGAAP
jgi:hypothetical protein